MMIVTTANIDADTYRILMDAHAKSGIRLHKIIHVLFKIIVNERPLTVNFFSRVRYQDRQAGVEWKRIHLYLNEGSYEACFDMRKIFKMSVSGILAFAVRNYLDRVIHELTNEKDLDNYLETYIVFYSHSKKTSNLTIYYTIPPETSMPEHTISWIDPPF